MQRGRCPAGCSQRDLRPSPALAVYLDQWPAVALSGATLHARNVLDTEDGVRLLVHGIADPQEAQSDLEHQEADGHGHHDEREIPRR